VTQLARQKANAPVTIEQALVQGDLSGLDAEQRVNYYLKVCSSLGLNPYTKPFDYLVLNSKLVLYARKDATDQLRKIHGISMSPPVHARMDDLYTVTVMATDKVGRTDSAIGAVSVTNLKGEQLANALMKAETKAKRRVTLSLCGLGMTDESEVDSIPDAFFPEPEERYVPTDTREVEDRDMVRSADERIWTRYLELLAQAHDLGLNPKTIALPVDRAELQRRGVELRTAIAERQDLLDREDADRRENERQRREEGLK
jgi:hypothetical protein